MNILLSAYACEPNKGSEPGVGWGWAVELSKHHNVWVITRDNNRPTIESYLAENKEYQIDSLHFIYVGISKKMTFWKKGRRGMRLFYLMWQRKAAEVASEWHKKIGFDLVQHMTFVSYTQPTYMYKLEIPLIWGPISGGEKIPKGIKIKMTIQEKAIEFARGISQSVALITPSIRKTMKYSKYILVATDETKYKIPNKYEYKTIVMPAIGIEKMPEVTIKGNSSDKIRIIMAGRLIYWKAFDIGLKAFMQLADKFPQLELHILGEGNRKESLKKEAGKYLDKQVFFENPVPHDDIFGFYQKFDVFLNTSLRDSGCMTMMEAMSVGLPCICIATGGPKILSSSMLNSQVNPTSYEHAVNTLSQIIERFVSDPTFRDELILASENVGDKYSYKNKVNTINQLYFKGGDECEQESKVFNNNSEL